MKKKLVSVLGTLFCTFIATQSQANLINNGGFEFGDYSKNVGPQTDFMIVTPGMTNITGWNVSGALGVHWCFYTFGGGTTYGNYSMDLQGNMTSDGPLSGLWTEFATTPGEKYTLSFDAFTGNTSNTATVSVGSLVEQSFTGGGPGSFRFSPPEALYSHYSYDFIALSSLSKLNFQVTHSDGYGPVLDNVSVEEAAPVPEPATMLLMGTGLAGLVGARRKKKK